MCEQYIKESSRFSNKVEIICVLNIIFVKIYKIALRKLLVQRYDYNTNISKPKKG